METVAVIIILAGLFYIMNKNGGGMGCCGGHGHSKKRDPSKHSTSPAAKGGCH